MDSKTFAGQLIPCLGGEENISRQSEKNGCFSFTVKDSGAVRLEELRQIEGVAAAELSRGRVRVTAQENYVEDIKMAKKDYNELADKIVDLVGGKGNVTSFSHCVTRLRFNVKDKDVVKLDEVKKLPGAVGAQWQGDQLQVIIGQSVGDAYQLICKKHGLDAQDAIDENLDGPQGKKKFSIVTIFDAIAGCITPCTPILIGGGFVKIIAMLMGMAGLDGTGTYTVLTFAGDAAFYFLPVFVGGFTAKKFGGNMSLGMAVGAIFIHPTFISAVSAGTALNVFGIPIYSASYSSTIFPAFLTVLVMVPVEKFFAKHSPDSIRSITEPLFTLLVMIPLGLCVLGPAGSFLGTYVSNAIIWLYDTTGFLGVAVFGALCPLLVMTGMHSALMPYLMQCLADLGWEAIVLTGMIISNIDQGVACLVVAIKTKNDKNLKSTASACAVTAIVGGVTEPGMYGVNLPLKKPLYGAMAGTFCGCLVAGLGKAVAYAICGSAGIFGLTVYLPGGMSNVMWMVAGIAVGAIVTFIATWILYKEPETK